MIEFSRELERTDWKARLEQIGKGITGHALASPVLSFASIKEYGKGVC